MAQTHLAMLKFHNAVCDMLSAGPNPPADIFKEARRIVTWHYQWIVLHDWVERLTEKGIVAKILHDGRKFYRFKKVPYMPVEFSAAAYRLGHSHGARSAIPTTRCSTRRRTSSLFFTFSGLSGDIIGDLAAGRRRRLPDAALATGSSTGGGSTNSATAAARRSP